MKLNQNKYCAILWKLSLPQGQPVWWSVTLPRRGFVSKIWIINRLGCCLAQMPKHNVIVETEKANCKVYSWKDRQKTLMICEPLISASNLTIYEDGVDDLSLCEVMIMAIGEKYKRFLLQSKWLFNIIIIHQIQNQVIQRNIIIIPPRCKFETLSIWTCWHPCCASETRSWCWLWTSQDRVFNPDVKK